MFADDYGIAVGQVQAAVTDATGVACADVAWIVGAAHQGRGFAGEAAEVMVAWLRQQGVSTFVAHIHPGHHASAAVARLIGLAPTPVIEVGEGRRLG